MNREMLYDAITEVKDVLVIEAMETKPAKKKVNWMKWGAVAACVCLIIGGIYIVNNPSSVSSDFTLNYSTGNVSGNYVEWTQIPPSENEVTLLPSCENENAAYRMENYTSAVFKGTVIDWKSVYVTYGNSNRYITLVDITVDEVLMGTLVTGETVRIWINVPYIGSNIADKGQLLMRLKTGASGIFMPMKCEDRPYLKDPVDGSTLVIKDFAEYYFEDVRSFAIFEDNSDLVYSEKAWAEIDKDMSLNEVSTYLLENILMDIDSLPTAP